MKETKDSNKGDNNKKDNVEESNFSYIEGLDIEDDLKALDIAGEAFQAY